MKNSRQYRTILMVHMRQQIFRQSKQKFARIVDPLRRIFVTNDGKSTADSSVDEFLEVTYSLSYVCLFVKKVFSFQRSHNRQIFKIVTEAVRACVFTYHNVNIL